ncbi:hypothetical protein [Microbulbifer pacificus]|uniref:Uncharacterized protein n=1 Tax=Microbulbifer pacificus TaxID=407164 RepID=A0AAU0MY83_9GAMM|nr:hypothetical protein [Microbulbifer pacificus]WOX04716.1 hypothetical protein R5R33_13335 [Microbulbifer pacificus]
MVNNRNISLYDRGAPPTCPDGPRKIEGGPLYPPAQVLEILEAGEDRVNLWTKKCIKDVKHKLEIELDEVAELVADAVKNGRYKGSEWCQQKPNGCWAASDAYVLTRKEWNERAFKYLAVEYFVKFAIAKTGRLVLVVSCHPPENRG